MSAPSTKQNLLSLVDDFEIVTKYGAFFCYYEKFSFIRTVKTEKISTFVWLIGQTDLRSLAVSDISSFPSVLCSFSWAVEVMCTVSWCCCCRCKCSPSPASPETIRCQLCSSFHPWSNRWHGQLLISGNCLKCCVPREDKSQRTSTQISW